MILASRKFVGLIALALLATPAIATVARAAARAPVRPSAQLGTAAHARSVLASAEREWRAALRLGAAHETTRFPSPTEAVLVARLRQERHRYGFRIVSVRMLKPRQAAPQVIVRSGRKRAIARATATIVDHLNPRHVTTANPAGYAYEGFFFAAVDDRGVPYLLVLRNARCCPPGGGVWASEPALYPIAHG